MITQHKVENNCKAKVYMGGAKYRPTPGKKLFWGCRGPETRLRFTFQQDNNSLHSARATINFFPITVIPCVRLVQLKFD